MKYTWEEYKKARKEHDIEMNCLDALDASDFVGTYNAICDLFNKNPDGFSVTLSRPIITLETWKIDHEFFNWLKNLPEDKIPPFLYYPTFGWWSFHKSWKDAMSFNDKGEWKNDVIWNLKTEDVWEKGFEIIRKDDTKMWVTFDEIELK